MQRTEPVKALLSITSNRVSHSNHLELRNLMILFHRDRLEQVSKILLLIM